MVQVAATVEEAQVQSVKEDKDNYLYYFCSRYPGRTLVFVNAISCLRRVLSIMYAAWVGLVVGSVGGCQAAWVGGRQRGLGGRQRGLGGRLESLRCVSNARIAREQDRRERGARERERERERGLLR